MKILENALMTITVNPEQGADIVSFCVTRQGRGLHVIPGVESGHSDLDSPCYLLIPYSNRIENGIFVFRDRHYQLKNAQNHAIHGDVRHRPWKVISSTDRYLNCEFISSDHEDVNWPWDFHARVIYRLERNYFESRIILTNRGDSAMPAGMGWHPYYNRALTRTGEPVHICMKVVAVYPDANNNRIPSGPPVPITPDQDFSSEKPLESNNFLDACFYGYDGNGWIRWPESGIRLTYECSKNCRHLIMYNPSNKPYFAVEPVTNANNGVNILAQGGTHSGVVVLNPGENLDALFRIHVELI